MWSLTWAKDDMIYAGAGDNKGCPMNLWRIKTFSFQPGSLTNTGQWGIVIGEIMMPYYLEE